MANYRLLLPNLTAAVLCAAAMPAQEPAQAPARDRSTMDRGRFDRAFQDPQFQDPRSRGESLYSLQRSQEETFIWERAQDRLQEGKAVEAVEDLHRLLLRNSNGVIEVGPQRYLGVRAAVLNVLREMQARGVEAYQKLAEREAGWLLQADLTELSHAELERLAWTFPVLPRARQARLRLGLLAMEAGDALTAAGHFRAGLDTVPAARPDEAQRLRDWLDAAAALIQPHVSRNHRFTDDDSVATDALRARPPSLSPTDWRAFGSGHDGTERMTRPAGRPAVQGTFGSILPADRELLSMQAVGGLEGIFISDGREVWALDPLRAGILWRGQGPMAGEDDPDTSYRRGSYRRERTDSANPSMVHAAAVGDDVVVAGLEVPTSDESIVFRGGISIMTRLPDRRLFAFSRSTGKLLWAHWDRPDDGVLTRRFSGHIASAPPIIHGDTVYCATHDRSGTIALYLSAYDLHTGEQKWRRLLCSSQQEVNMFGNAQQDYAAGALALSEGVLYGTSNLGICYAVAANSGDIRWISGYSVINLPPTRLHGQRTRPVYFANNPPVITDGVVVLTPLDSEYALGLDALTGRQLWELHHTANAGGPHQVRWVLGAVGDEVMFSGRGVVAVKARPDRSGRNTRQGPIDAEVRSVMSPTALGHDLRVLAARLGRGAITDDLIFYSGGARLSAFDFDGNIDFRTADLRLEEPGNLTLVDGIAVSVRGGMVQIAYDPVELRRRAVALLDRDPDDVLAQFRLANLLRVEARAGSGAAADQAIEAYEVALRLAERSGMGPGVRLWDQIARDLYDLTLERAKAVLVADRAAATHLFRQARDRAPDPEAWMAAQMELLGSLPADEHIPELRLMARSHGALSFDFGDFDSDASGELPVAAFALWREALLGTRPGSTHDPAAALLGFQDLLERYPDETFAGRSGRELATDAITQLIEVHGPEIYEPVAARAAAALAAATTPEQLQHVASTWPHSAAARQAIGGILDGAVAAGDLATVCRVFDERTGTGTPNPGLMRRLMVTANAGGNQPLARAMGRLLRRHHGGETSDLPADGGATYAELAPVTVEAADPVALDPPEAVLQTIDLPMQQPRLVELQPTAGFAPPTDTPVYVTVAGETLLAFDPTTANGPATADGPIFRQRVDMVFGPLFQAGTHLIAAGLTGIRAYHYRTGAPLWDHAPRQRGAHIECVGGTDGVIHAFASAAGRPSELIGLEATTGTVLFRREFAPGTVEAAPRPTGHDLLLLFTAGDGDRAFWRVHPTTGAVTARVPLTAAARAAMGLTDAQLDKLSFRKGLFASADTIYVPNGAVSRDASPRVAAIAADGSVRFVWKGSVGGVLHVHALRDDTLVLVESLQVQNTGRLITVDAGDGTVRIDRELGNAITPHNWQPSWSHNPAPRALLLTDRVGRGPLRLTCLSLDAALPSFQMELPPDLRELKDQPILDDDLLVFAAHSIERGAQLKLFAIDPRTRSSALDGAPHLVLDNDRYSDVRRAGRFTVVGASKLLILGRETP